MATSHDRLTEAWSRPSGFVGWLAATNHRSVGVRYMVTAFIFFLLAGLLALLIRIQLVQPELDVVTPETFNQLFTMHGATMMFLFAVPMLEGLGIYFIPLMIGARDMAFPRLNAFGYWMYLFGGVILYAAFLLGSGPDSGWFNYTPLSGPGFNPTLTAVAEPLYSAPFRGGAGIDFYLIALTMLEVAALVAAVELIVTMFKLRAPGMAVHRLPLFGWAQLVTAFMIIFAMPVLMTVSILLEFDRKFGTQFFNIEAGGSSFLWQHLFWFFGHPDVYIMLLPAFGIISTVIAASAKRPIVGYVLIAMTLVAIGFLSFGLWVHHMYAGGFALMGLNFFAAASMMITIPSGLQIFAWIATMWHGALNMTTAFLFSIGTVLVFVLGGITGVMVASPAFDWQVHDTYFVVAHFHYVLIGGALLPIFAGLYHWLPKITGRMLNEGLGKANFWLLFIGTNVTFFPMHQLGFDGMPRRVYTYLPDLGLGDLNVVATIGAIILGLGVIVFIVNLILMFARGKEAGDNPWEAGTLEWATTSPPQQYNFATIPVVKSRHPLWEQEGLDPVDEPAPRGWLDFSDTTTQQRETYITTMLEGTPQAKAVLPAPSRLPLWLAVGVTTIFVSFLPLVGFNTELLLLPVGAILTYMFLVAWVWPSDARDSDEDAASDVSTGMPHFVSGTHSTVWWGMIWFLVIEAVVLGSLIFTYFYLRIGVFDWPPLEITPPEWPQGGINLPSLMLPAMGGALLIASAAAVFWANRSARQGNQGQLRLGLVLAIALAGGSLIPTIIEYMDRPYGWTTNAYGSIVWVLSGYQTFHVLVLVLIGVPLAILVWRGLFHEHRYLPLQAVAMFWYYVVAAWILYFATVYLSPHLI